MYRTLITCILLFGYLQGYSQLNQLVGTVKDKNTLEEIPFATIFITPTQQAILANEKGVFITQLSTGEYIFNVSAVGYEKKTDTLWINTARTFTFFLEVNPILMKEIVIEEKNAKEKLTNTQIGVSTLTAKEMQTIPIIFGERDPVKFLQLQPGIKSSEGSSGLHVRGSGSGNNLILLDDAYIYNPTHLFGFMSAFNPIMVKDISVYKAGIPAAFGYRSASVINIQTTNGDMEKPHCHLNLGLLASNMAIEGPIKKQKSSYFLAFRRTYLEGIKGIASAFLKEEDNFFLKNTYYFYDANAKFFFTLSKKDYLSLSGYLGSDHYGYRYQASDLNNTHWGNQMGAATWTHQFTPKAFVKTTLYYTAFNNAILSEQEIYKLTLKNNGIDKGADSKLTLELTPKHTLITGISYINSVLSPLIPTLRFYTSDIALEKKASMQIHQGGIFIQDDYTMSDKWRLEVGLRGSGMQQPSIDSLSDYHFFTLEPRLSVRYSLTGNQSLKGAYNRTVQYLHFTTMPSLSLPTDLWVPSSASLAPEQVDNISLGHYYQLTDGIELSTEIYYKYIRQQIDFKEGVIQSAFHNTFDENIASGTAEAYGIEWFLKKKTGTFTGWLGYSYSKIIQQIPAINKGEKYVAYYDKPHDLSLIASYQPNKKWVFSATFILKSGNVTTLPKYIYIIQEQLIAEYDKINSYRLPTYHRMDISSTYSFKLKNKYPSQLTASVYNVYNRANPFFVFFDIDGNISSYSMTTKARQVSLFPILPSISWQITF